jgi:CHAD domain-containing protein
MPSIRMDAPAGEAVRRLMRKTLRSIGRELDNSRGGAGVHAARRKIKLARSLLRLSRKALSADHFDHANRSLRAAAKALAPLRSAEAMGETVAKLRAALKDQKPDEELLAALADAAGRLKRDVVAEADKAARIEVAATEVTKLRKAIAQWTLPKSDVSLFVAGMRAAYARARRLLRQGLASGDIALIHEARKSVIHHLHHIETLAPLWPKLFKVWTAELQTLREALGDLNDLDELEAEIDRPDGAFAALSGKSEARRLIALRRKAILAAISDETGHLFAEQPKNFASRMLALWEHMAG